MLWSNISCQKDDIKDVYIQPTFTAGSEDDAKQSGHELDGTASDTNDEINLAPVTPFIESSSEILSEGNENWNDRPGVAIFDFDNDNDLDLYITQKANHSNRLYQNNGKGIFTDIAKSAGVELISSHSTGVMTCDINNDGLPDLYVGAWGDPEDQLDFRSPSDIQGNADTLFLNNNKEDIVKTVQCKPNRAVIFDARIPHLIRPSTSIAPPYRFSLNMTFKK